jgi:hypothetical protein
VNFYVEGIDDMITASKRRSGCHGDRRLANGLQRAATRRPVYSPVGVSGLRLSGISDKPDYSWEGV